MRSDVNAATLRALVWRWDGASTILPDRRWTYDLFYGQRREDADAAAFCGRWYTSRAEAFDAACAELRKRGES